MFKVSNGIQLILASASPRRQELLAAAGLQFKVLPSDFDESLVVFDEPAAYVKELARKKAMTVAAIDPGAVILAADTIVVCDGTLLGKPADDDDARRMLTLLSGKTHQVWGGIALYSDKHNCQQLEACCTEVQFVPLSEEVIEAYLATAEHRDKAGAYAIQGGAAPFVSHIKGSYTNIVGLDMACTISLLEKAGWISPGAS